MTSNRIVCTEQTGCTSRGHIIAVGVGTDPSAASSRMTVAEVYSAMDRGQVFYTADRFGRTARVRKYACPCGRGSLQSDPDASAENNLDSLRMCSWRAA